MSRRPRASAWLIAIVLGFGAIAHASAAPANGGNAARKSSAEQRQAELRERIRTLKNELAKSESKRNEARDALHESETAISDSTRQLRDLAAQQRDAQARLTSLGQERAQVEAQIAAERARIAELVRAQYLAGHQGPWQLLLAGENPNTVGRNLMYLGYFARASQAAVARLEQDTARLGALADTERQHSEEIAQITRDQESARKTLQREKQQRSATLQKVSDQIRAQRKEVGALERDAARLNGLINSLSKLIADEERKARARRDAAKRAAQQAERDAAKRNAAPGKAGKTPTPPSRPDTSPARPDDAQDDAWVDNGSRFASTRGKLRLPVRGDIVGRFGQARADSKMTWKGIFIGAPHGSEVKAIAAGRVVFADWLRGFGNLLIVDHGDQYLSIYGGNETMYKQAGQTVNAGEAIATVGSTGGAEKPGLYFELRHRGEPFDPLGWVR